MQNKNLKLKLSLCGLALTSFLAINAHSTVHADTVDSGNANQNAITWDSDNDDSQAVKEEPQQEKPSQSVQTQGAVQSSVQKQEASVTQSVQSNVQNRAEKSAVRVSSFDTSTVNRLNTNSVRNNQVKVATVHDTSQMPVQKQKVAQFNQGSKIYTLNGSNQLSKNNGDGYVITNAGTYNGRAVDIGVTINNVQNNQGTYTTKWSNGDKADVTGKTDANFKYQDSVLLNQQQVAPIVNQTRPRQATEQVPFKYMFTLQHGYTGTEMHITSEDITGLVIANLNGKDGSNENDLYNALAESMQDLNPGDQISYGNNYETSTLDKELSNALQLLNSTDDDKVAIADRGVAMGNNSDGSQHWNYFELFVGHGDDKHFVKRSISVTDNLQVDQSTPANLNYNYTVGLYDAQTGDLITDLKAEYKGKTGNQATASTSVMNNAIKSKIQQINQGKATVSYTGTSANDDVAFYQETRQVNPQSTDVNRKAQRVIHVTFPNGVKPASYDGIVDANNDIVQTVTFTRTGTENVVSGQKTYGPWQQHGGFSAVTLPDIPGYTMTTTGV